MKSSPNRFKIRTSSQKGKILFSLIVMLPVFMLAQTMRTDSTAIYILDRMSSVIGQLQSCSYTLHRSEDILVNAYGTEKHFATDRIQMVGPDKMTIQTSGNKGQKGFWYNGKFASRYHYDENNYTIVAAPDNIIAMIDTLHNDYGLNFPAADFFNPYFTYDLIAGFDNIVFLGKRKVEGVDCFYIMATNTNINLQFWISDGADTLPKKFLITYKNKDNMQFEATFEDWVLNPNIPDAVFDFIPPLEAKQLAVLPKLE